jgi:hypothetical protein
MSPAKVSRPTANLPSVTSVTSVRCFPLLREILAPKPTVSPQKFPALTSSPFCDLCAMALTKALLSLIAAFLVYTHSVTSELLNS